MDTEQARQLIRLADRIKELNAELDEIKAEHDALEAKLLDEWATEGITSIKLDDRTLYVSCRTYATFPQGKDAAVEVLKTGDHADIVQETVNSNTASALVRELTQDGGELPASWVGIIGVGERYSIGIRKA